MKKLKLCKLKRLGKIQLREGLNYLPHYSIVHLLLEVREIMRGRCYLTNETLQKALESFKWSQIQVKKTMSL